MKNGSTEQKPEVGKGIIKADILLKQFARRREELQQSFLGIIRILTNLKKHTVLEIISSIPLNILNT